MLKVQDIFKTNDLPIWIMRQAGRYLPEYKELRASVTGFLDLCYNPAKAAQVTLQPLNRFDINAAIIFSDILVLPDALGCAVKFKADIGPVLKKFESERDLIYLDIDPKEKLNKVYEAISNVKAKIDGKPLIGFAGSPWTVATYMIQGGKGNLDDSRKFVYNNKRLALKLIEFLSIHTISHLKGQIRAGADIIKLFDSWAGVLQEEEFTELVINPTAKIVREIKKDYPHIPIIGFPKGSGFLYEKYIDLTGIDVIAVDYNVPLALMRLWQDKIIVQGNLDPAVLLSDKPVIKEKLEKILTILGKENYIFNLGHGILKETDPQNVEYLIKCIRDFKK